MSRRGYNLDLPPLPADEEIVEAVRALISERPYRRGVIAREVAQRLGVVPANRLGRGASKGNWSGTMNASARIAPRMAALARAGRLTRFYDTEDYRWTYLVPHA